MSYEEFKNAIIRIANDAECEGCKYHGNDAYADEICNDPKGESSSEACIDVVIEQLMGVIKKHKDSLPKPKPLAVHGIHDRKVIQ